MKEIRQFVKEVMKKTPSEHIDSVGGTPITSYNGQRGCGKFWMDFPPKHILLGTIPAA